MTSDSPLTQVAHDSAMATPIHRSVFERGRTLWAAITVSTCALMSIGIFPLVLGLFADRFSLSLGRIGVLATVGQCGGGLGSLLVFRLRRRRGWRWMLSLTAMAAAVLNGLALIAHDFFQLCALQFAFGMAAGVVNGLALYIVGRTPKPERAFGLMYAIELAAFAAFAAVFPMLRQLGGFPAALNSIGAFLLAAALVVWALPDGDRHDEIRTVGPARQERRLAGATALVALTVFEAGIVALWAYAERIGVAAGIGAREIGVAISLSGLAGMAGAAAATGFGVRSGNRFPVVVATLVVAASDWMLLQPPTFLVFALAICVFNFGWLLALPSYMGAVVAADATGALTSLIALAQQVGTIIGPLIAAVVVGRVSMRPVVVVSFAACLVAAILLFASVSAPRPKSVPADGPVHG